MEEDEELQRIRAKKLREMTQRGGKEETEKNVAHIKMLALARYRGRVRFLGRQLGLE